MLWLNGLDYDTACERLEENGYQRIAEGDWAYVYQSPESTRVVRITPYDPAYLLFVHTCWMFPQPNLPAHQALVRLSGSGYAVEMPRYIEGRYLPPGKFPRLAKRSDALRRRDR